ncbi:hypothetical protein JTB14_037577 [Gonioctena quinquepunctata]|nr:hypothetical protein JTB14_037577 [Gonioctena quinquepunctata]
MKDGEHFIAIDEKIDDSRIIALFSKKGKNAIASSKSFYMDGTFKSCPKKFTQIYTIHIDLGGSGESKNIVPVLYAMCMLLKKVGPEWNPMSITLDFEEAAILTLIELFPDAKIQGCDFHWNQCLWRKVQEIELVTDYY